MPSSLEGCQGWIGGEFAEITARGLNHCRGVCDDFAAGWLSQLVDQTAEIDGNHCWVSTIRVPPVGQVAVESIVG